MVNRKKTWTIWFVGLHGSGKTTISRKLADVLRSKHIRLEVFDGDEVRKTISSDLGYSLEDRNTHMKRVADLCKEYNDNEILSIACVASPTKKSRDYARNTLRNIVVVYVKCPVEVCEKRDVKGHYKKARNNEEGFENFLGITLPFEEPKNADLILETDKENVEKSIDKLINFLGREKIIVS